MQLFTGQTANEMPHGIGIPPRSVAAAETGRWGHTTWRQDMRTRMGEKIGWVAGWTGGFIWVCVLSMVFLFQGRSEQGLLGAVLTGIAVLSILFFAPWRFPSTPYWKLMLAPYGVFFLSIAWAIWSYGGPGSAGLTWWNLLWFLPLLSPLGTLRKRKWADSVSSL
jgi:hypothetical protein